MPKRSGARATLDVMLYWQVSRLVSGQFPELSRQVLAAAREALL